MNYTIIKDLIPTYVQYEDTFEEGSFLVDGVETTTVPDGIGTVSATVHNRWSLNPPHLSRISGNRLLFTEYHWGKDTFFDGTASANNVTPLLGTFPTQYLNTFSTSWQVEAKFSEWLFQEGTEFPYKPDDNVRCQTGIFINFNSLNIYAKIYLQFNANPGDIKAFKVMADVFRLDIPLGSGTSFITPLPEVVLSSHPTDAKLVPYITNFIFRLTGKNRIIDFEYSEDNGENWNTLYTLDDDTIISPDFNNECTIGLYFSNDHDGVPAFPDFTYTLYEYMKLNSWGYSDVTGTCTDFYYTSTNNNYFEYVPEVSGTSGFTQLRQEEHNHTPISPPTFLPTYMSTFVQTPITYTNNEYGVYAEILLKNPVSVAGVVLYSNTGAQNFIIVTINAGGILTVFNIKNGVTSYVYSEYVSGVDFSDWVELGVGFDSFDNTIIFWLNDVVESVVRIDDFKVVPQTYLGLLPSRDVAIRNSSIIKVEDRIQRDLNEDDYSIVCSNNTTLIDLGNSVDAIFEDYTTSVENIASSLSGVVASFASADNVLDTTLAAASITEEDLEPELTYEEALLNSGIAIINGVPVIEGSTDIQGYARLYEFFPDVPYIESLITSSTGFIFIVTKNKYAVDINNGGSCFSNVYNEEDFNQYPSNNILCSVDGEVIEAPTTGEIIGETIIGINISKSSITDSIMQDPDKESHLNYYLFWIDSIDSSFMMLNKLRVFGLNNTQLLVVDTLGLYDIENINVYLLPLFKLDSLQDLWGEDGDTGDILNDPPAFDMAVPADFEAILQKLDRFRKDYPEHADTLDVNTPDFPIPSLDLEEEPQLPCLKILEFLENLQTQLTKVYTITQETISDPLSYLSETWKKILAAIALVIDLSKKQGSLTIPSTVVSGMFTTLFNAIDSIMSVFMTALQSITLVFSKGLDMLKCVQDVLDVFGMDLDEDLDDALGGVDFGLSSMIYCLNEIQINVVKIIETIKRFVGLFNLLLLTMTDVFLNLKLSIAGLNIDELKNLLKLPNCNVLVKTVQKMLESIEDKNEDADEDDNDFETFNNNITVE